MREHAVHTLSSGHCSLGLVGILSFAMMLEKRREAVLSHKRPVSYAHNIG
jgi:hypothetical protein